MKIEVPLPRVGRFPAPGSYEDAVQTIKERKLDVRELARRAFEQQDGQAWYDVQSLLYHWNLEELERTTPVTDLGRFVRQSLRNEILPLQFPEKEIPLPFSEDNFDRRQALEALRDMAHRHRITRHPLLAYMSEHGLSPDSLRIFLENYYINNRVFHLHVAAQSLSVPLEMRAGMYQNLFDELGRGVVGEAHPVLFLKNFRKIGLPDEAVRPLGEALNLLNTKIYFSFLSGDFRKGIGGLGLLELTMPAQMQQLYDGMLKSGLSAEDAVFWKIHIDLDAEHGEEWIQHTAPYIETLAHAKSMVQGGMAVLDARAGFYDGVWAAISEGHGRDNVRKSA